MAKKEEPEQLLTVKEATARLRINPTSFYKYRAKLMALGLQQVRIGRCVRYRESSVNRVIKRMAEREIQV